MKKSMRRLLALGMALCLLLSLLTGCNKNQNEEETTPETSATTTETTTETLPVETTEQVPETTTAPTETTVETEAPTTVPPVRIVDYSTKFVVTGAESLNVRAEASTDAEIIDGFLNGAFGEVTGISSDDAWYQILLSSGMTGYIAAEFVTVGEEAEALIASIEESRSQAEESKTVSGNNSLVVCIDAGHQQYGISEQEPNGPGSSVMKAKLTSGTQGCVTGRAEYVVNLEVSLKLQQELEGRGYTVVMVRTTNDCPMSNAERAQFANNSGANCFIRVHCNSVTNTEVTGVISYAPSPANPYLSQDLISNSISLASKLSSGICGKTGAQNRGVLQDDTMTGINWCQIPVTIVEMGFMSNPTEDQLLSDPDYQWKLAKGMADGIDAYFGR